ncbi:hypothetical protein FIU87_11895 [Bacillus sp. THAF10]|nr:hypothetical protein FIU87_11895 [Bacillus sp. THAF10]
MSVDIWNKSSSVQLHAPASSKLPRLLTIRQHEKAYSLRVFFISYGSVPRKVKRLVQPLQLDKVCTSQSGRIALLLFRILMVAASSSMRQRLANFPRLLTIRQHRIAGSSCFLYLIRLSPVCTSQSGRIALLFFSNSIFLIVTLRSEHLFAKIEGR